MLKSILLFLLFLPITIYSQTISGKVYDSETTINTLSVLNTSKKILTYTDEDGNFEIEASIKDTLSFRSLFHHNKTLVVTSVHFNDILVIELKKIVNELDEVLLKDKAQEKKFDSVEIQTTMNNQLKADIKNNPHLYNSYKSGGMDFVAIAKLIGKLFKRKKKQNEYIINISYNEFNELFCKDNFFDEKLLTRDLKIPINYKSLFFEFCDAKGINNKLLLKENKFILLDTFYNYSEEFLEILSQTKKN